MPKHTAQPVAQTDFDLNYQELNPAQKQAVDTIEGPVMVIAGAGTGKTQAIAMRIAKILHETDVSPQNILCLTFTESGVRAMRERLIQLMGKTGYYVRIYTFHSFCNEVINDHPEKFPELGKNLQSLSELEKLKIIKELLAELSFDSSLKPYGNNNTYLKNIADSIADLKKENILPEKLAEAVSKNDSFWGKAQALLEPFIKIHGNSLKEQDLTELFKNLEEKGVSDFPVVGYFKELFADYAEQQFASPKEQKSKLTEVKNKIRDIVHNDFSKSTLERQRELIGLYKKYQAQLVTLGKYDYEDMIMQVVQKFQADPELLADYQEQFQYILVDEYQDTNGAQNQAVKLLGSYFPNPNVFVVGDDDQAIYRFQGASVQNLFGFYQDYQKDLQVFEFRENYRSQQLILDAAAELISHNTFSIKELVPKITKKLQAGKAAKNYPLKAIDVYEFPEERDHDFFLAQKIKELLAAGVNANQIAILYRDNKDANSLRAMFDKLAIPYVIEKGEDVLQDDVIKRLLELFEFFSGNPRTEDYHLFQVLHLPFFHVPLLDLAKVNRFSTRNRLSLLEVLNDAEKLDLAGVKEQKLTLELGAKLLAWRQQFFSENALKAFTGIIKESGFFDYVSDLPQSVQILSKMNSLYEELKKNSSEQTDYHLHEFLRDIELYREYDLKILPVEYQPLEPKVRLMTVHAAKGMEYEYVFIVKFNESKWNARRKTNKIRLPHGLLSNELTANEEDDQRRLFYVALTRAKKQVFITSAKQAENRKSGLIPSPFLLEIPEKYLLRNQVEFYGSNQEKLSVIFNKPPEPDFTYIARNYLKTSLKDFKLNASNLESYLKCPRCFYFQKLLKIPQIKDKTAAFGTAVHSALASFLREFASTKAIPSNDLALQSFEKALAREILTKEEYQDSLSKGRKVLKHYLANKAADFRPNSKTEYDFNKKNVFLDDIPVTGKIDRIDFLDEAKGRVAVLDYKTGNPDRKSQALSEEKFGDYFRQLVFYKLLCEHTHGLNWQVVKGAIAFVETSEKNHGELLVKEYNLTQEHVNKLIKQIKEVYAKIINLEFAECGKDCENEELHKLPYKF